MISIWAHFIIMALVTGVFVWDALRMRRKIDDLRAALTAKQVMSGVIDASSFGIVNMTPNDTLIVRTQLGQPLITIMSSNATMIDFKVLV